MRRYRQRAPRILLIRTATIVSLLFWLWPVEASADWHLIPFIGLTFGGDTNFVDLEKAAGEAKRAYGGSVSLLGAGVLGLEIDFVYSPAFFQRGDGPRLVSRSNMMTLTGNVIVAAPLGWSRESLRPYLVGGVGLMHAAIRDVLDVFKVDSNLWGMDVGGGVIGFFTDRTGIRLEIRYFRNLSAQDVDERVGFGTTRLSTWRASAGLVLRR